MIIFAAPTVNEVNLYWSGNRSVLRGWASAEGIPRLYQESCGEGNQHSLKKVTIHWMAVCASQSFLLIRRGISHITQGFESYERCTHLLEDFINLVQQRTREIHKKGESSGIVVKITPWRGSKGSSSTADAYLGSLAVARVNSRAPPVHAWIESMEKFRLSLMMMHTNLPKHPKPEGIKVSEAGMSAVLAPTRTISKHSYYCLGRPHR